MGDEFQIYAGIRLEIWLRPFLGDIYPDYDYHDCLFQEKEVDIGIRLQAIEFAQPAAFMKFNKKDKKYSDLVKPFLDFCVNCRIYTLR